MRGQSLTFVLVIVMQFGNWVLAESPSVTTAPLTNQITEVIPIKYALASEVATVLNTPKSGESSWVSRALVTPTERATLYGQVQALGAKRISCDERSNSLLVAACASDLPKIKEIIGKLDVVLSQVLFEGVILQFPLDDREDSSRSEPNAPIHLPPSFIALTNVSVLSTTRFSSVDVASKTNPPESLLSYEATLTGDLDALLTSLASSQGVRILQRPRIQTSVGVPATMFVGYGPPCPAGGSYTCGCLPTVSSLDVGVTIEVACMLTTDGTVLTDIQERVDKFVRNVTIRNVGNVPVTDSYSAQAHVALRDRQIIALGGLVQAAKRPIFTEVEALNKLPLAGHFLNQIITSPTRTKRYELMVLIRPNILPAPEAQAALIRSGKMPSIKHLEMELHTEERNQAQRGEPGQNSPF